MRKFLIGVMVGGVLAFLATVIVFVAIKQLTSNKTPAIAGNSVLVLTLDGEVPEVAPVDISLPFFQSQNVETVRDLWTALHNAQNDKRIRAVLLQPKGLTVGWAKLQEIREELIDFKKSGKPLYANLQGPGSREYYLASVADKIYISPDDFLDVKGFRVEAMYFKNALDKLGITFQVDHIGKYKDAGDMFVRNDMSPETKEVYNEILDQLYGDFCTSVGQGRHKTADEVRQIVDMGPFVAGKAKELGLVDAVGYEDDVYADLKKKVGADLSKASINAYYRALPESGDRIAVLAGQGDILRGGSDGNMGDNGVIASGAYARVVRQVRNDRTIKGVIVRIDSPGGDAVASDEILHELKLLSNVKPVVISMSDLAASGGYFMAMTGDPVLAYPNTITGSIGVIYGKPNLHELYNKLGIQEEILTRGKLADVDSAYVPLSEAGKQKLHDSIQVTYRSFVSKVAAARKRNYDQIDSLAQGRVWMGTQARANGLVDELGGMDRAVVLIRQRAKLSADGSTNLVMFPARRSLFDVLGMSTPDNLANAAAERQIRQAMPGLPGKSLMQGGILSRMPFEFLIH